MNCIQKLSFLIFSILICTMRLDAQKIEKYDRDWKLVEDNINKGLPVSALETVKKIYAKAKAAKQDAQIVKAITYMVQLQQENREDNLLTSIKDCEKEISNSPQPAKSLLNSYLAGLYEQYFLSKRHQLYGRTQTLSFNKEDIATWSIADFTKKISQLYLESLKEEKLLQRTPLESYDALIIKGNVRHLRPTLYDLLAHQALNYFKSDERNITKPAYRFEINQPKAFLPAKEFATANFETKDSLSLQHKALLIYQKLIRLHLNDAKPDALIDVDLSRLEFVNSESVIQTEPKTALDKDHLYYNAVKTIADRYGHIPAASQAWYLLAKWHEERGSQYNAYTDTSYRYELVEAKKITEKILSQKKETEGWTNANNLNKKLQQPVLSFNVERVNIPDLPFRMRVTFKNIKKIHLRLIPTTDLLKNTFQNTLGDETYWSSLVTSKPLKSWTQPLPENTDLQTHSTEIKIDGLPKGQYFILASSDSNFSLKQNILATRIIYVSNISYVNNQSHFYVLNRSSGQPLEQAQVQVWKSAYNYTTSSYKKTKIDQYVTDQNGSFQFTGFEKRKISRNNNAFFFEIVHKNDSLFMDDEENQLYVYNSFAETQPKKNITKVFLFTDRSIYRPGQTVFFKGIVVNRDPKKRRTEIIPSYKTTVTLLDANRQKIDSVSVTSNEYGSFNGKFALPESGLNGVFTLSLPKKAGTASIRMEEYKRPKFYVEFEKIKGTYKVNEDVTIKGFAKAYAGNNIDGATVKYRVVREARFPYHWLFRSGYWPPPPPSLEVAHGETTTRSDGAFDIHFKTIPDLKLAEKTDPVFDYTVYADITDINGETRNGKEVVSAGYKSLIIKADVPEKFSVDSLHQIKIRTENMAGIFEKTKVHLSITSITPEQRLLRPRYWERSDQFVMTKEEYIKQFPNDIYANEDEPASWPKDKVVIEREGATDTTGAFTIGDHRLNAGNYLVEVTAKDKDGKEVKDKKYVELFSSTQKKPVRPAYLSATGSQPIEPGKKTFIELGSSAKDVFIIQSIDKGTTNYDYSRLNNENKRFEFSAAEADRGGYGVSYIFVKDNRIFQYTNIIDVPWTNKDLTITYHTFRDKTLPGAEEKWTLNLQGYKKEKAAAEMLASMYDASLDQFYPHQWTRPALWQTYRSNKIWNEEQNFSDIQSLDQNTYHWEYNEFDKRYDQLFNPRQGRSLYREMAGMVPQRNANIKIRGDVAADGAEAVIGYGLEKNKVSEVALSAPQETMMDSTGRPDSIDTKTEAYPEATQIRKNFNETAFFFPDLKTDRNGDIHFSFTMPEALTRWKFQAIAHSKNGALGYSQKEIITQKNLMVQPNPPRFFREGDQMKMSSKVVNLSDQTITGVATLQLLDAATGEVLDRSFKNTASQQSFTISPGQSEAMQFPLEVPQQCNRPVTWRISATSKDGSVSDGEENMLPVLTNRILVTETLPLAMRGSGTKSFRMDKLINSAHSKTLTTQSLTVEYASNPAWYAVQALPYMMEYPYECAEQTWNRYYANSLATMIAGSSSKIKTIFEQWKNEDTASLLSNLQKNQELKTALLEETPWVLAAKTETQQKKNLAVLFDLVRMSGELSKAYDKLRKMQSPNGGFVWFSGGPDDRYITQYIVTGIGHLRKINAIEGLQKANLNRIIHAALPYLDRKVKEDYDLLLKNKTDLNKYMPSHYVIQYLYMRSFFPEIKIPVTSQKAVNYFRERARSSWTKQNKFMQGMIALASHRSNDDVTAKVIVASLKETAINNEELGMYYKDVQRSWWWYQAPVERQALIIEAFDEISNDQQTADNLRTWLLKNKHTNNWESTKATAEACYALLLKGSEWLTVTPDVNINLGETVISSKEEKQEAGTGYFKKTIEGNQVRPSMGNIKVSVDPISSKSTLPTWGGIYWQYFEAMDKITSAETPLKLSKQLFIETNTDRGPILKTIQEGDAIKVGDKIKVRVELRVDRDMEYVHMKDMRAAAFEPVNVLSGYKWQGGLGYYETTRDAATHFFFNYLRKGSYVFEYSLFAGVAGFFSNGITSIQCMYAPEFSSHSEGIRIRVE